MSKLQEINRKIIEREALSSRLAEIKEEINQVEKNKAQLELQVQKELDDVLELEKLNVRRIFAQVLGDYKQMLEKERQEYLMVVLEHKSVSEQFDLLRYEEKLLSEKLANFGNLEEQKNAAIKFKELNLKKRDSSFAHNLYKFDKDIAAKTSHIYKLEKTLKEGEKAKNLLRLILDDLHHVSKWGPTEMKGKGKLSSFKKKQYIDKATDKISRVHLALHIFETKLKAYFADQSLNPTLGEFEEFISLFYDHLITDWIVQNKIKNSSQHIESQMDNLKRYDLMLQDKMAIEKGRLEHLKGERQKFVESF